MIRRAVKEDIPQIENLLYQIQKIHSDKRPDIFREGQKKYTAEELEMLLYDENRPIFVHEGKKNAIDGYVFCIYKITKDHKSLCDRKVIYIDDLCVDENNRGNYIGTKLYKYVVALAEENDFDSIVLNVWNGNEDAMRFYRSCGMKPLKTMLEQKLK